MTIAEGNKRVLLTFPEYALEAFKEDARRLNMTLSAYAFLVLGSTSSNLPDVECTALLDRLENLEETRWRAQNPEKWEALQAKRNKKNSSKNS